MSWNIQWVFQCQAYSYDVSGIHSILYQIAKCKRCSGSAAELFALLSSKLPAGSLPPTLDQFWELMVMLYPIWPFVRVMCHIKAGQQMINIYEDDGPEYFPVGGSMVFPIWMCQPPRRKWDEEILNGNVDN